MQSCRTLQSLGSALDLREIDVTALAYRSMLLGECPQRAAMLDCGLYEAFNQFIFASCLALDDECYIDNELA